MFISASVQSIPHPSEEMGEWDSAPKHTFMLVAYLSGIVSKEKYAALWWDSPQLF